MEIIEFVNDDDIVVVITDEGQFDVDRGKFDRWIEKQKDSDADSDDYWNGNYEAIKTDLELYLLDNKN